MRLFIALALVVGVSFSLESCKKNRFKKKTFLPALYDYKIEPELLAVQDKMNEVVTEWENLSTSVNQTSIDEFKKVYKEFLVEFQSINFYNLGDISSTYVYNKMNKFSIDTAGVWDSYNSYNYFYPEHISALANNKKGVYVIEYLLFNPTANDSLLQSSRYVNFLDAHFTTASAVMDNIVLSWGVYEEEFTTMTDDGVEGSYNIVVNRINHTLEDVVYKRLMTPEESQDIYSNVELQCINKQVISAYEVFVGDGTESFNSVFNHLRKKNKKIAEEVKTEFEALVETANGLDNTFEYYLNNEPSVIEDYRAEVINIISRIEVDVIPEIGLTLTVGDNDGD